MFRIAIQVKELIASNVTSALEGASDPAKMLAHLQREIEEALVGLHGELSKTRRQKDRLDAEMTRSEQREADWSEKAKIAMDHDREDLARQALIAREDCRSGNELIKRDIQRLRADIDEIEAAERELETKRADVRQRYADQLAADGNASGKVSNQGFVNRTERRLDHIEALEKRTDFATEDRAASRSNASVEREIEDMRRDKKIEEELAALRGTAGNSASTPAKKSGKRTKAA